MLKNREPVYYGDYLKLPTFLECQTPLSKELGQECHEETLFIIVHQVFELWFKQILHELSGVSKSFSKSKISETELAKSVQKLERILKIQQLFSPHLDILETMSPMEFLEFRELLIPASGFQSVQFRKVEIILGLATSKRQKVHSDFFLGRLNEKDRSELLDLEKEENFFDMLSKWLERIPFLKTDDYNFWDEYKESVILMLNREKSVIEELFNESDDAHEEKKKQLQAHQATRDTFKVLLDKNLYDQERASGKRKLSHKATLSALFILLYRDHPIIHTPYRLLTTLMDIDENFTSWRYRHALLAHRMLGTKIGTGGSAGHLYLKQTAETNRIFKDLFELSTFLIPSSSLPKLPKELVEKLGFNFS